MAPLLLFMLIPFLSLSRADDRAHGLSSEPPVAVSPEAFAFFHPGAKQPSTLPLAATVKSAPAHESQSPATTSSSHKIGAGGIAGISLSFLFVALVGMGVFYKRRAYLKRAKPEQHVEAVWDRSISHHASPYMFYVIFIKAVDIS